MNEKYTLLIKIWSNLNTIFKLAENDLKFRKTVTDIFLFNATPPKDFFSRIKNANFKL